jgi:putative phosphoribosyl transferase
MGQTQIESTAAQAVQVPVGDATLQGDLAIPAGASGLVVFAHGSGSGRNSPRNRFVAEQLQNAGLGTLLVDLLTEVEEAVDRQTLHLRFDIELLAARLVGIAEWLSKRGNAAAMPLGYFGASTGGGAALVAAARHPERVAAVVSRGGRPDLAGDALPAVRSATLLIVGGNDPQVIELNKLAFARLRGYKELVVVPEAGHLFEEPGTLEEVARLAADWFTHYFRGPPIA